MKLLFLDERIPFLLENKGAPIGGASTRVFQLVMELSAQGHQVGILTWMGAASIIEEEPDFDIVESYRFQPEASSSNTKIKGYDFIMDRYLMYKQVKSYKPDFLFQICSAINTGVMAFIAQRLRIPFVFLAASNADADGDYVNILGRIERYSYDYGLRKAKLIVCQNAYQTALFRKRFSSKPLLQMPNPFKYRGKLPRARSFDDRGYVAWLGNFSPVKNLPVLVEIAKALPEVKFRVAGSKLKTTNTEIQEVLEVLEKQENVELVGSLTRSEVLPFLANAYLILNTSILEGFSNTFLESLAVGTPIVTRNCIDPDGVITKNKIGITVEEYKDLSEAILRLINDPDYPRFVDRCVEYVQNNHDVTNICKSLLDKLEQLSQSRINN